MTQHPKRDDDDAMIEQMLADLATVPDVDVPDSLMARVLADADAMLPAPGGASAAPLPWWRQIVDGLGGWSAVSGVVAAAATGFVIGLGGIDSVVDIDAVWAMGYETYYDSQDPFGAFGWDLEEG